MTFRLLVLITNLSQTTFCLSLLYVSHKLRNRNRELSNHLIAVTNRLDKSNALLKLWHIENSKLNPETFHWKLMEILEVPGDVLASEAHEIVMVRLHDLRVRAGI